MKTLVLAALVAMAGCGSSATCGPDSTCSHGARYHLCNTGGATGCYYEGSDGSKFLCKSCGDCTSALSLIATWCESAPAAPTSPSTGGTTGSTTTIGNMCGQSGPCPSGSGSYTFCTDSTATNCGYKTSDGKVFACSACTNCTDAANQVTQWCTGGSTSTTGGTTSTTGGTTGGTTSTSGGTTGTGQLPPADHECQQSDKTACEQCCGQRFPTGVQESNLLFKGCICNACSDCAGSSECGGTAAPSSTCTACVQAAQQQTCLQNATEQCLQEVDCKNLLACEIGC